MSGFNFLVVCLVANDLFLRVCKYEGLKFKLRSYSQQRDQQRDTDRECACVGMCVWLGAWVNTTKGLC